MRTFTGILFGLLTFKNFRDIIILTSFHQLGWEKIIHVNWKEKIMKVILKVFNRRLNVAGNVDKIFVESICYFLRFNYIQSLSKIVHEAVLGDSL